MARKEDQFPGFDHCMWMMRRHDPAIQEDGFHALLPHAGDYIHELIREFRAETDHGLRCWLLELIGEARSDDAFDLLAEELRGPDESLRLWAIYGLEALGSKPARRLLWDAQWWEITPADERDEFTRELRAARDRIRALPHPGTAEGSSEGERGGRLRASVDEGRGFDVGF